MSQIIVIFQPIFSEFFEPSYNWFLGPVVAEYTWAKKKWRDSDEQKL